MDTQRIEQLFTLIANKSKSQDNCDNNRKFVQEILDNQRTIVEIDVNVIEDAFQTGGEVHGFTVSVNATIDHRMRVLMEEVRKKAELYKPFNRVIVFFFMPEMSPITMDELLPLNEWLKEFPDETMVKWGMAINPPNTPQTLKTIVLLGITRDKNPDSR